MPSGVYHRTEEHKKKLSLIRGKNWKKEEDDFLRQNYLIKSNIELAEIFNITFHQIRARLRKLNLKRPKEIYNKIKFTKNARLKMSLAQRSKTDHYRKNKMLINGEWIKCNPKKTIRCNHCNKILEKYKSTNWENYFCNRDCYRHWQSENYKGKNNPASGIRRLDLIKLNKSRIGIPLKKERIEKQRKTMKKYWNSTEGLNQKIRMSKIMKLWCKQNKEEVIRRAKNGHKSCPRISSQEILLKQELKKRKIFFISQYEYKLGFMDFFIPKNIAIFVDGIYWHNYPYGTRKDKKVNRYLKSKGYKVLRFWEHQIKNNVKSCVDEIIDVLCFKDINLGGMV